MTVPDSPTASTCGNAGKALGDDWPLKWSAALDGLQAGAVMAGEPGRNHVGLHCAAKRKERDAFNAHVPPYEYDGYL